METELNSAVQHAGLRIEKRGRLRSSTRPATITVAGHPASCRRRDCSRYGCRHSEARSTFFHHRPASRFKACRCGKGGSVGPRPTCSLLTTGDRSWIQRHLPHRFYCRSDTGRGRSDEEGWPAWHIRTLFEAQQWSVGQVDCALDELLLKQTRLSWTRG